MANTKKELLEAYEAAKQILKAKEKDLLDAEKARKALEKRRSNTHFPVRKSNAKTLWMTSWEESKRKSPRNKIPLRKRSPSARPHWKREKPF
jgi:hypothetical protein